MNIIPTFRGFFALLLIAFLFTWFGLVVFPWLELGHLPPIQEEGSTDITPWDSSGAAHAGEHLYAANGCAYCHTQQVRPLDEDKVFGRPSAPGDFKYQTPELLGSERTGPDLTNIAARQPSSVWQYIHLYNPRAVVPESIMPSFNWMFDIVAQTPAGVTPVPLPKSYAPAGGVVVPTHQADALIAYLASLKQPALPASAAPSAASVEGSTTPGLNPASRNALS